MGTMFHRVPIGSRHHECHTWPCWEKSKSVISCASHHRFSGRDLTEKRPKTPDQNISASHTTLKNESKP